MENLYTSNLIALYYSWRGTKRHSIWRQFYCASSKLPVIASLCSGQYPRSHASLTVNLYAMFTLVCRGKEKVYFLWRTILGMPQKI